MMDRRKTKRDELRESLIAAAQARIARSGLSGLRARDVTADAGSALGGLYNAFADLDDLILHVGAGTLARLRGLAEVRLAEADGPRAALQGLAAAYLAFARENHGLWSALFDHRPSGDRPIPDWFMAEQTALIRLIAGPLERLMPGIDETARLLRARTLFGAIHGIVVISTEERFVGIPGAALDAELVDFVDILVSGIEEEGSNRASFPASGEVQGGA